MQAMKLSDFFRLRWVYRAWYYFRLGYSTYLTFILGYATTLVTIYYLAVKNLPDLLNVFPHFELFVVVATAVGVPLAVAVGWAHMKGSGLYVSEMDVASEANPYLFKLYPGYWREVFAPTFLTLLEQNRKILASNKLLSPEEDRTITELERKIETLISGGYVGRPRRKMWEDAPRPG
jgi:hypothetical protein